jgi:hypothetical protein
MTSNHTCEFKSYKLAYDGFEGGIPESLPLPEGITDRKVPYFFIKYIYVCEACGMTDEGISLNDLTERVLVKLGHAKV